MQKRFVIWSALIAAASFGTSTGAAPPRSAAAPSFNCAAKLSADELAICRDPELAAWDRAMAVLYPLARKGQVLSVERQRDWLTRRKACAHNLSCLRDAYRSWPGFEQAPSGFGTAFDRVGTGPDEPGELEIRSIGAGWFLFSVQALTVYNRQTGNVHTGEAVGVFQVVNGHGHFTNGQGEDYACEIDLAPQHDGSWTLSDNLNCGGMGVTMSGEYRPITARKH